MAGFDSALVLQAAIIDALKAAPAVSAIVGAKVYTRPPASVAKPYISMGPAQVLSEIADDYEGGDIRFQVDGWSVQQESTKEIMSLGAAVAAALQGTAPTLGDDQRLVSIEIEQTRYLTDPDGVTQHAVIIGRARTEPSA